MITISFVGTKRCLPEQQWHYMVIRKDVGERNVQLAVCRRLMLLISVNKNGKRLSCSNERWQGESYCQGDKLITDCGATLTKILESLLSSVQVINATLSSNWK